MTDTDVYLTDEHRRLRSLAQEFARTEIVPRIDSMEASGTHIDRDTAALMAKMGWAGILIPAEYGGMDAGNLAKTILLTETSYASGAVGGILQASLIPAFALRHLGDAEQKKEWLPRIAAGLWSTIAVTEPDHGSDVLGMTSTARRHRDGSYTLDARKTFIGNSGIAGVHLVIVRTAKGHSRDPRSLSAFLCEADRPGVTVTQPPFIGMHGFSTGDLTLTGVRVPAANLVGDLGDGLAAAYGASMVCGRLNLAAVALGLHRKVRDVAHEFVRHRPRRNGTLADLPAVQAHLAEIESRLLGTELTVFHASHLLDQALPCDAALVNAKLTANRGALTTAREAAALFGGYAVRADYPLARVDRDLRHIAAPAGPDDIQLLRLAEVALRKPRQQWSARFASPHAGRPNAAA